MTTCAPTDLDEAIGAALLDVLTDQVQVKRLARTPDTSGGSTEAYADHGSPIPAYIAPSGGGELIVADRLGLIDAYTITVPWGSDILDSDRLAAGGLTFQVQYVPKADTAGVTASVVATVVA